MPELKRLLGLAPLLLTMTLGAMTLAACSATTGATTGTTTTTSQPMPVARTPEQIKGDCWMKYENDPKMNLDKRSALVDQCIAEHNRTGAPIN